MKKLSMKKKYFITIALVSIISLCIVSVICYIISYELILTATKSKVEVAAQRYSNQIDSWLAGQTDRLNDIQEDIKINSQYYNDEDNLQNMLTQMLKNSGGNVMDYYIGFNDKRLVSGMGWQPPADYNCMSRDWYIQAMKSSKLVYTLPYVDADTKKMVITISEPLIMNGQVKGVLAEDITLDYLVKMVNGIKITDGSHAFLIDNQKNIMTYPDNLFLPTDSKSLRIDRILGGRLKPLAAQIDSGAFKPIKLKDYDGRSKYFYLSEINSSKWIFGFSVPTSVITQDLHTLLWGFAFAIIISIIISMIVIFFLLKGMLKPIMYLTKIVRQFGEKKMDVRCRIGTADEVGELGRSFNNMADIIQNYSMTLEKKVEERTRELNEKNVKIQDSIEYAKMIQQTILPDDAEIGKTLKDYFIIWNPRDVVGGDLYWMRKFDDGFIIVVGDCTGHGVPGALMTMAVSATLNHIVDDICHDDPAFILNELNRLLYQSLRRGRPESNIQDGLDAGIICVSNNGRILYSAAQISLFVINGGESVEIKGNRHTIGAQWAIDEKRFENNQIGLTPGMSLYLATDGVKDQVGGEDHLPFGKKRLMSVLESIQQCSMEEQKGIVWSALKDYMNGEVPRDDVTVLGFRL